MSKNNNGTIAILLGAIVGLYAISRIPKLITGISQIPDPEATGDVVGSLGVFVASIVFIVYGIVLFRRSAKNKSDNSNGKI